MFTRSAARQRQGPAGARLAARLPSWRQSFEHGLAETPVEPAAVARSSRSAELIAEQRVESSARSKTTGPRLGLHAVAAAPNALPRPLARSGDAGAAGDEAGSVGGRHRAARSRRRRCRGRPRARPSAAPRVAVDEHVDELGEPGASGSRPCSSRRDDGDAQPASARVLEVAARPSNAATRSRSRRRRSVRFSRLASPCTVSASAGRGRAFRSVMPRLARNGATLRAAAGRGGPRGSRFAGRRSGTARSARRDGPPPCHSSSTSPARRPRGDPRWRSARRRERARGPDPPAAEHPSRRARRGKTVSEVDVLLSCELVEQRAVSARSRASSAPRARARRAGSEAASAAARRRSASSAASKANRQRTPSASSVTGGGPDAGRRAARCGRTIRVAIAIRPQCRPAARSGHP